MVRFGLKVSAAIGALCAATVSGAAEARVWTIAPGDHAQPDLQEALAKAGAGDVIRLASGRFELNASQYLAKPGVSFEGAGPERTVLSFRAKLPVADLDANGSLILAADHLTLRGFSVIDSVGPAIVGRGLAGLTIDYVSVRQSPGLHPPRPVMGMRIFASHDVLFQNLDVRGATVSGLQISTSERVVIRDSRFEENSTGLEVENDYFTDIHDNVFTHNAAGLMLLDMPSYPHIGGHAIRVFRNEIIDNNAPSAARGIAAASRTGTGLFVMGGEHDIHIFDNNIGENGYGNVLLLGLPWQIDNPDFNAVPNDITVRDNVFGRSGFAPMDNAAALQALGEPLADVMWDGATRFIAAGQIKTSEPLRLTMKDNVRIDGRPVSFMSMGLTIVNGGVLISTVSRSMPEPARTLEPKPISLPQDQPEAGR